MNAHGLRQKKSFQDLWSRKQLAWVSPHCISTCSPTILSFTRDGGQEARWRGGRSPPRSPPESPRSSCSGRSFGLLSPLKIRQDLSDALADHHAPEDRPEGGQPWRRSFIKRAARTSSPSAMLSGWREFLQRRCHGPEARCAGDRAAPGGGGCYWRRRC